MSQASLLGALVLATLPIAAHATPAFYDDRASFTAQTAPNGAETFEALPFGAVFESTPLDTGFQTLTGGPIPIFPGDGLANIIGPGGSCEDNTAPNGSKYACAYAGFESSLRIDFAAPISAWGADFRDIGDGDRSTSAIFFDANDAVLASFEFTGKADGESLFFGVDLGSAGALTLVFQDTGNSLNTADLFGFDNVLFTVPRDVAPIPLPASVVMLLSALAGVAGVSRRRRDQSTRWADAA